MYYPLLNFDESISGMFLATADTGQGAISKDNGVTFQSVTFPVTGEWVDAAWGGLPTRYWVIISKEADHRYLYSNDGETWFNSVLPTPVSGQYAKILWTGTYFAAITTATGVDNATISKSATGLPGSWTAFASLGTIFNASGMGYSPSQSRLVAFASLTAGGEAHVTRFSDDAGLSWVEVGVEAIVGLKNWRRAIWLEDYSRFVVVANGQQGKGSMYGTGLSWSNVNTTPGGFDMALAGTTAVAVGVGTISPLAYVTINGIDFNSYAMPQGSAENYYGVAWNGSVLCAVQYAPLAPVAYSATSSDLGQTWVGRDNMPATSNYTTMRAAFIQG
jgi:hypothetical protein